jgi:glucan phosphoethanolaminetransferase (alkaline phosphatase superfamily)
MDLNTLIIEDIGEVYTMLNMSYIKIMVLFTILLVLMLVWSYKDKDWWETFKTPIIAVVIIMILLSVIQSVVMCNCKDKNSYTLQIIDLQTKDVLSSKSITKEDSTFIKGLKLKRAKGQPISENEDKKLRLIINDMKPE